MSASTAAAPEPLRVGTQDLADLIMRLLARVRAGETVEVTEEGKTVARIVPVDDRYEQLVAAGVIRPAKRPFDVAHLPEPQANPTGRATEEWLAYLRSEG